MATTIQCDCEKDLTRAYQRTHSSAVVRPDGSTVECSLEKIEKIVKKGPGSVVDGIKKDLASLTERVRELESGGSDVMSRDMLITYEDGTTEAIKILTAGLDEAGDAQ